MKKHEKVMATIAAIAIIGAGSIIFIPKLFDSNKNTPSQNNNGLSLDDSTNIEFKLTNDTFDEENIGELYYSPIDSDHIAEDENGIMYSDNEILVVAADGVGFSEIEALAKEYNAEIVGYIEQTGDYQWKINKGDISELVENVSNEELVSSASINYITEVNTDSVLYDIQPGNKWSTTIFDGVFSSINKSNLSWNVRAINAPLAWQMMNLNKHLINPVNIGLIDNGFDQAHEDLGFKDVFYDDNANGVTVSYDDETDGHGTHVAGTMAARGDNEEGVCGIYPYANDRLYGVAYSGIAQYTKNGDYWSSVMNQKIAYSELILRNVKVINQSQGYNWKSYYDEMSKKDSKKWGTSWDQNYGKIYNNDEFIKEYQDMADILGDFLNRLNKIGYDYVLVTSAGNTSTTNTGHLESRINNPLCLIKEKDYKEVYDRIIVVGSVGKSYQISDFSDGGNRIDICAPGEQIFSTVPFGNKYANKMGSGAEWSGTSMASPHVAGVCANVWSIDNALSGKEIKKIVLDSTLDNVTSYTTPSGRSIGTVDCYKAVMSAYNNIRNGNTDYEVPKNGGMLGWVTESDRSTAVSGVKIIPFSDGNVLKDREVSTDDYGHFEIVLPAGEYKLKFSKTGYVEKELDVTVKNGEITYLNEGIDEVISVDKEMTNAEKYAQIVMDNEKLWFNPWVKHVSDGMTNNEVQAWFQDLDFDGIPEFIVGYIDIPAQSEAKGYDIYRFTKDGKMKKIVLSDNYGDCSISFSRHFRGVITGMPGYVYKDGIGEFRYICDSVNNSMSAHGCRVSNYKFGENQITEESIYDYFYIDMDNYHNEYFTAYDEDVSMEQFSKMITDEISNGTFYWVNIGTIPFTSNSSWITGPDETFSDGLSSVVCGCYDNLSTEQKKTALVDSYNAYSLTEDPEKYGCFNNISYDLGAIYQEIKNKTSTNIQSNNLSALKSANSNAKTAFNAIAEYLADQETMGMSTDRIVPMISGYYFSGMDFENESQYDVMNELFGTFYGTPLFESNDAEIYIIQRNTDYGLHVTIQYRERNGAIGQYPNAITADNADKVVWGTTFR